METHFWPWLTRNSWEAKPDARAVLLGTKQSWSHSQLHSSFPVRVAIQGDQPRSSPFQELKELLLGKKQWCVFVFFFLLLSWWIWRALDCIFNSSNHKPFSAFSFNPRWHKQVKKKLSFANLLLCFYATSNIQESSRSRELAQVLLCWGQKTSIRSGKGSCGCCCTLGSLTPPKEDEDPNLPVHTNTCIAAKLQPTLCLFAPSQAVALHKQ